MPETRRAERRDLALQTILSAKHDAASIRGAPPASRISLRTRESIVGAKIGLDLPVNRCLVRLDRLIARLGPDEWILIAPEDRCEPLAREIERALAGTFYALTDISHRQLGIEVCGPAAAEILNVGCPLDLHTSSFPSGSATRTVFGKAEIMLMRPSSELTFRIEVWRSFSAYVLALLNNAAALPR